MSEVSEFEGGNSDKSKKYINDPKAKFREALERKKQERSVRFNNTAGKPKVSGGQASGKSQKMFRRKSGSV